MADVASGRAYDIETRKGAGLGAKPACASGGKPESQGGPVCVKHDGTGEWCAGLVRTWTY